MRVDQIFSFQNYLEGGIKYKKRELDMENILELDNKLQRLSEGSKSVDDYHKEMEMTMIIANILEDQ
ncbi:hypothetical protein CR513_02444, partial [Mucuna pruriens]